MRVAKCKGARRKPEARNLKNESPESRKNEKCTGMTSTQWEVYWDDQYTSWWLNARKTKKRSTINQVTCKRWKIDVYMWFDDKYKYKCTYKCTRHRHHLSSHCHHLVILDDGRRVHSAPTLHGHHSVILDDGRQIHLFVLCDYYLSIQTWLTSGSERYSIELGTQLQL